MMGTGFIVRIYRQGDLIFELSFSTISYSLLKFQTNQISLSSTMFF